MSSLSKKTKYTAADADGALRRFFTLRQYLYHMSNKYLFSGLAGEWESDFIAMIKKSQYFSEVEIKVNKSDFYKDFEKPKHKILEQVHSKGWAVEGQTPYYWKDGVDTEEELKIMMKRGARPHSNLQFHMPATMVLPHRFFFCYPEGLIPEEDVPKYAGILIIRTGYLRFGISGPAIREIRKAPLLHKRPIFENLKQGLLDKFFYETFNARMKADYKRLGELRKKLAKDLKMSVLS